MLRDCGIFWVISIEPQHKNNNNNKKTTKNNVYSEHVRPPKIQISLRIRAV